MKLKEQDIDRGFKATMRHGFGTFFPRPPELSLIKKNWRKMRTHLASCDLDIYNGYSPIRSFAPKSRLNIRRTTLLHPFDFILYTALALKLKNDISKQRLPADRVFSYRAEDTKATQLYSASPSLSEFRDAAKQRIEADETLFVGVTDIADFFARIYHHRLVNALDACASASTKPYVRVLEKMLARFSDGASYGIPIGPPASRLLSEATLIDVDSVLVSYGIEFIRFVDDYLIFGKTAADAEYGIRVLGETLFLNHGLTLQTAKTRVMPGPNYLENYLTLHSEKEKNRRNLFATLGDSIYEDIPYEELDEEQKREIDSYNLVDMLRMALAEGENVDYQEVSFILGRLSSLRKPELISIVLENLERLYPVADAVSLFFSEFRNLETKQYQEIGSVLLRPMLDGSATRPSEFYAIWILNVFAQHDHWDHGDDVLRIFRETNSDTIRRYAAFALGKSGARPQAVAIKDYVNSGSPLSRSAMLLATAKLAADERKFFRKSLRLADELEKICADSAM